MGKGTAQIQRGLLTLLCFVSLPVTRLGCNLAYFLFAGETRYKGWVEV